MKLPFSPARVPGSVRMRKVCSAARNRPDARTSPVQSTPSEGPPGATVVGKIGSADGATEGAVRAPPARPGASKGVELASAPTAPDPDTSCPKASYEASIPKTNAHKRKPRATEITSVIAPRGTVLALIEVHEVVPDHVTDDHV